LLVLGLVDGMFCEYYGILSRSTEKVITNSRHEDKYTKLKYAR